MKNIMVVDGAMNCAYDVFQATDEEFRILFPGPGQDIAFAEDMETQAARSVLNALWQRPARKNTIEGLHGMLFFGLLEKRAYYPNRRDADLDRSGRAFASAALPRRDEPDIPAGIDADIRQAYGNPDAPHYGSVRSQHEAGVHDGVLKALQGLGFSVTDATDPDSDVALILKLEHKGRHCLLALSLVGPYAALRVPVPGGSALTAEVLRALSGQGVRLLDDDLLARPYPIRLPGEGEATLFNALFSLDPLE